MPKVNRVALGGIIVTVPPLAEQRRIADFIDARCAAIDAAIEKKERMLEAEGERKHLARNQLIATTSRHTVPLRRLLRESPRNGISPPTTDRGSINAVLSFSLSAIRNGVVDLREDTLKSVELESHAHHPYVIRRGDVFVVRGSGNIALVGRAARLRAEPPEHCVYPDIAIRLSPGPDLDPDYLVHVFDSDIIRHQIDAAARTSNGAYKISGADLKNLAIPIMSLSEQRRVAAQMTLDGARSDSIAAALTRSIVALREYRTALITAAVTGKLELPAAPTAAVAP
jgi:type I restriction enzyme S subunit